jgi:hypothetical protein
MASCNSKTLISGQGLARVVEYSTSTWYYTGDEKYPIWKPVMVCFQDKTKMS